MIHKLDDLIPRNKDIEDHPDIENKTEPRDGKAKPDDGTDRKDEPTLDEALKMVESGEVDVASDVKKLSDFIEIIIKVPK